MKLDQFKKWIARGVAKEGGQIKFADKHNIDRAVMSLVLSGKRDPSKEFAKALGWRKETIYTKEKTNG